LNRTAPRSFGVALAVFVALCTCACAVPLAPGYRILKESREVQFVPGQPPQLRIRARFELHNSGSSDLTFIDVDLPDERTFGRGDLRVEVGGREATPAKRPEELQQEQPDAMRIPLDPPWKQKQNREVTIECVFRAPEDSGARITLDESNFHLGSRGWFPLLLPPKHLLSANPGRPKVTPVSVRVPADFLVLARGTPKGQKKEGGEIEYRFELYPDDLALYVTAGRYTTSPAHPQRHSAVFWTLQPLSDDAGPAAERLTAAWRILETDFGPLDRRIAAPHIVESPGLRAGSPGEESPAVAPFPGGALVNPAALSLKVGSDRFLDIVTRALARNWFGDQIYPAPDAAVGIGEGLPEYATIVIDEARNGPAARRRRVLEYLRMYDDAASRATEQPLGQTRMTDPAGQRRIAVAKAALFFVALEDACGEAPMRKGLAQMLSILRGQEADYNDLRTALEQSSGKGLGQMFRIWLNEKGIPVNFREQYPAAAGSLQTGE
jgi:hypothetical protein